MDAKALTLYTHPMSRGRIARWMIEEVGLPYETVVVDYGTTMKSPDYLRINPMGKVPALTHGDMVVTENAAICMYLADLVPQLKLAPPAGSPERGSYYRWMLYLAGPVEALFTAKSAGTLAQPQSAGYGREEDVLATLEAAVQGREHLVGDYFTAADLFMAAFLGYYMRFNMLAPRPAFTAFVERHMARPAQVRAAAIDNELVARHPHP
jgi:glutathione S-transferase